jgi:hypothetical protein
MATKQAPKNDSARTDARDVAIDVRANDLKHLGTDTDDLQHYFDAQRERVIVTTATHDEYTATGSALVRRSLVAGAPEVDQIIDAGGNSPADYVEYVDEHVDGTEWAAVQLETVDLRGILGDY